MPEADELEPVYLTLEDIFELYAAIIDGTTAQARHQLRDPSSLGLPRSDPELAAWVIDLSTGLTVEELADRIRVALVALA